MTRLELVAAGVGVVVFLWLGGQHGAAALVGLAGGLVYAVDLAFFDTAPCSCEKGKVWSPLTQTFKIHSKCGGSGFRPRFSRRLWHRRG